jgi:hypothetical protein
MLLFQSAIVLACLYLAHASPFAKPKTSDPHSLFRRSNTVVDCDAPLAEPDPDPAGPQTQADFLNRATADMAVLANLADTIPLDSPASVSSKKS